MSGEPGVAQTTFGKTTVRQGKTRLRVSASEEFRWVLNRFLESIHCRKLLSQL